VLNAQIEGFVAVAREGNLRRAAELLYVSQPALTARIQGLEAELGTPLFRRTRSGMELTHAGRAFLPYAQRALESLRGGSALVAELAAGVVGELAIGSTPGVSAYVLPELLARFTERFPNVRLLVRTSHSEQLVDQVVRGEVQLAVVREMRDARISSRPLFEDELVLVARPEHPFARDGSIDIAAIHGAQLILFDRTSSYYDLTNALFRSAGVVPRGVMELDNIEAAKRMVERGLGVALLPGTAVAQSLVEGTLVEVGLVGVEPIERRMVMVERQGVREQTEVVTQFVALLERIPDIIPRARPVRVD
jgi:DNA-binding transcriptional LysR family regulator